MKILLDSKTTNFIYSINYHFIPIRARITAYDLQNGRKNLGTLFKPRIVFNIRYFQPFFELNTIHGYGGILIGSKDLWTRNPHIILRTEINDENKLSDQSISAPLAYMGGRRPPTRRWYLRLNEIIVLEFDGPDPIKSFAMNSLKRSKHLRCK